MKESENSLITITSKKSVFFKKDKKKQYLEEQIQLPRRPDRHLIINLPLFKIPSEYIEDTYLFEKANKKFEEIVVNLRNIILDEIRIPFSAFCNLLKNFVPLFLEKGRENKTYLKYLNTALKILNHFIQANNYFNSIEKLDFLIQTISLDLTFESFEQWLRGILALTSLETQSIERSIDNKQKFHISGISPQIEILMLMRKMKLIKEVHRRKESFNYVNNIDNLLIRLSIFVDTLIKIEQDEKPLLYEAVIEFLKKIEVDTYGKIAVVGLSWDVNWFFQWFDLYREGNKMESTIFEGNLTLLLNWIADLEKDIQEKKSLNENSLFDGIELGMAKRFKFKMIPKKWNARNTDRQTTFKWRKHLSTSSSIILMIIGIALCIVSLFAGFSLGSAKGTLMIGNFVISSLAITLTVAPLGILFGLSLIHRVFFFLDYDSQKEKLNKLNKTHFELTNDYQQLKEGFTKLSDEVIEWRKIQDSEIRELINNAHVLFTREAKSLIEYENKIDEKKEMYTLIRRILSLSSNKAYEDDSEHSNSSSSSVVEQKKIKELR